MLVDISESDYFIGLEGYTINLVDKVKEVTCLDEVAKHIFWFKYFSKPSYWYFGYLRAWSDLIRREDFLCVNSIREIKEVINSYSETYFYEFFKSYELKHKSDLRFHQHNEVRNLNSLKVKLGEAIKLYSRSTVIRVDIGMKRSKVCEARLDKFYNDFELLRSDFSKRQPPFNDLVLFAWALEQGETKGYHCHILLVFNGHKRNKCWGIAQQVGKRWEEITERKGYYFNCHDKDYLKVYERAGTLGIGMIQRDDTKSVDRMFNAVRYLVKPEKESQHLRMKTSPKMRTFGMSQL
ncbi:MAG: inovirus-type Gp2 protein [Pseudomonadota bacterium]|nr:inovirus-type Gp2 protein [Pseudomonadota bacterium]